MKIISYCTRIIEYSFYALFFLVPLVFASNTSELFEFNKMWLTFGLTIIITTVWLSKMLLSKRFVIQRTPLDLPILLFLVSQIISTIFSLDQHVSVWGYYSRFNGGLLSTITYVILYYAFVSNLEIKSVLKTLNISLLSGLIVALWGFPSHFGADPTCFVFRGSFDTSCWTNAFKPTIRAFSTIGQPDWFAAYLAVLLPISMGVVLITNRSKKLLITCSVVLVTLFYVDLIFSNARAGFIAFWLVDLLFWGGVFWKKFLQNNYLIKIFLVIHAIFLISTFVFGSPIGSLAKFTLPTISSTYSPKPAKPTPTATPQASQTPQTTTADDSITDSGKIRLYVWHGAIDAWKANLQNTLIGTGVETFAFAYYQYRPKEHNLTSEWDYLYNKAHNEYLNYLTTTGIFGLGTYLAIISVFLWLVVKSLLQKPQAYEEHGNKQMRIAQKKQELSLNRHQLIIIALVSGFVSILITNFFGFSVVIMNLFLFLIPAFVLISDNSLNPNKTFGFSSSSQEKSTNLLEWTGVVIFAFIACFLLLGLFRYWYADVDYALGTNLDHANQFEPAYQQLTQALSTEPNEPVYQDEASLNFAALSAILYSQKDPNNGAKLAQNAIALSNQVVSQHPNDVVFWKDRVRVFFTIAQGDTKNQDQYYEQAFQAIEKASKLAPTDAKTWYNYGVLAGQMGDVKKGIDILQHTIYLKPDYRDAYFGLGLFYHQLAVDKDGKITDLAMQQKAIETYQYILDHVSPGDTDVEKSLKEWNQK